MSGHTPGPWEQSDEEIYAGSHLVAEAWRGFVIPDEERLANAALIARAPELLAENEKLRGLLAGLTVDGYEGLGGDDPVWILRLPVTDATRPESIMSMKARITAALKESKP